MHNHGWQQRVFVDAMVRKLLENVRALTNIELISKKGYGWPRGLREIATVELSKCESRLVVERTNDFIASIFQDRLFPVMLLNCQQDELRECCDEVESWNQTLFSTCADHSCRWVFVGCNAMCWTDFSCKTSTDSYRNLTRAEQRMRKFSKSFP